MSHKTSWCVVSPLSWWSHWYFDGPLFSDLVVWGTIFCSVWDAVGFLKHVPHGHLDLKWPDIVYKLPDQKASIYCPVLDFLSVWLSEVYCLKWFLRLYHVFFFNSEITGLNNIVCWLKLSIHVTVLLALFLIQSHAYLDSWLGLVWLQS